jgi:hypothetical protein
MSTTRTFRFQTLGALAFALFLAAPVAAQYAEPRRYPGQGSGWNDDRYAYQNGFRAGEREGERDGRDRRDYGFKRDDAYENGDQGFRGGDRGDYKRDFRRGYEAGYDQGYRRHNRGGGGGWGNGGGWSGGGDWGRPSPGGIVRAGYDNGFRDGQQEGRDDARRNRRFDPAGSRWYRSGDRDYNSGYGPRDAYRSAYRDGFRAGYERGYRDRRW